MGNQLSCCQPVGGESRQLTPVRRDKGVRIEHEKFMRELNRDHSSHRPWETRANAVSNQKALARELFDAIVNKTKRSDSAPASAWRGVDFEHRGVQDTPFTADRYEKEEGKADKFDVGHEVENAATVVNRLGCCHRTLKKVSAPPQEMRGRQEKEADSKPPLGWGSSDRQILETDSDTSNCSSDLETDPHIAVSSMDIEVFDMHLNQTGHVELYKQISMLKRKIESQQKLLKTRQFLFDQKKQQLDVAQIQVVLTGNPNSPRTPIILGSEPWAPGSRNQKHFKQTDGIKALMKEASEAKRLLKWEKEKARSLNKILGQLTLSYEKKKNICDSRFSEISRGHFPPSSTPGEYMLHAPQYDHLTFGRIGFSNDVDHYLHTNAHVAPAKVPPHHHKICYHPEATVNNTDLQLQNVSLGSPRARDQSKTKVVDWISKIERPR